LDRQKFLEESKAAQQAGAALEGDGWPEFGDSKKKPKPKPKSLDYWELGNKYARLRKDDMVAEATCEGLAAVWRRLESHGWAIIKNMKELFDDDCKPSREQADYILKTNLVNKFATFDNAVWKDTFIFHMFGRKT
jgi:hypothetical protein